MTLLGMQAWLFDDVLKESEKGNRDASIVNQTESMNFIIIYSKLQVLRVKKTRQVSQEVKWSSKTRKQISKRYETAAAKTKILKSFQVFHQKFDSLSHHPLRRNTCCCCCCCSCLAYVHSPFIWLSISLTVMMSAFKSQAQHSKTMTTKLLEITTHYELFSYCEISRYQ